MYGSSACRGLMDSDVPGSGNSQIWSFNSLQPGYHHSTIVFTDGQVVAYDNGAPLGDPIASPELVFDEFGGDHRGEANGNANTENQLYWYALHIVSDPNYVYTEPVEVISKDEDANTITVDGGEWISSADNAEINASQVWSAGGAIGDDAIIPSPHNISKLFDGSELDPNGIGINLGINAHHLTRFILLHIQELFLLVLTDCIRLGERVAALLEISKYSLVLIKIIFQLINSMNPLLVGSQLEQQMPHLLG